MFIKSKVNYDICFMYGGKNHILRPGQIKEMPDAFRGMHNSVVQEIKKEVGKEATTTKYSIPFNKDVAVPNDIIGLPKINEELIKYIDINHVKRKIRKEIRQTTKRHEKLVTLCMCLKNRKRMAWKSIKSIVNDENAKYFNFIIVEDKSENMLSFANFKYRKYITHYIVDTQDKWNRSKLLNYGFKRAKTPLVAAWDADFLFPENFTSKYFELLHEIDFGKTYLWIAVTETKGGLRRGYKFAAGELYGGFYTYSKRQLETLRGFDETFVDYGHEEKDFGHRTAMMFDPGNKMKSWPECSGMKYRYRIKDVIYHVSHSDKVRSITKETVQNKKKMFKHYKSGIAVLTQKWGESKFVEAKNISIDDSLIVMGNGPSLKEIDFESLRGCNTIGMNGAYRYYYKMNWWPTYFCCFDYTVTDHHAADWKRMIEDDTIPIRKYYFLRNLSNSEKMHHIVFDNPGMNDIGKFSTSFDTFKYGGNTGVNSCQVGMCLGFKKIVIVGVDCNYVQVVEGARQTAGGKLVIEKQPTTNPNYFADDYQKVGDVYNVPNAQVFHKPAWEKLAEFGKNNGVEIVNCSPKSTLDCFRKSTLKKEFGI